MAFTREQFFSSSFLKRQELSRKRPTGGASMTPTTEERKRPPNIWEKTKRVFWRSDEDLAHEADVYAAREKARKQAELEYEPKAAREEVIARYHRNKQGRGHTARGVLSDFGRGLGALGNMGNNFAINSGGLYGMGGFGGQTSRRRRRHKRKPRYEWIRVRR